MYLIVLLHRSSPITTEIANNTNRYQTSAFIGQEGLRSRLQIHQSVALTDQNAPQKVSREK